MNGIVQSWGDSLKVFIPGNFKLFFLVTLKSFLEGVQVFLKYFWWFIVLQAVLLTGAVMGIFKDPYLFVPMSIGFLFALLYFWVPVLRPSVGLKNASYFVRYLMYLPLVLVLFVPYYYLILYSITLPMHWLRVMYAMVSLITLFVTFFYFESDGSPRAWFKSIGRALKFIIFNAPGVLVFSFVFVVIMRKLSWVIEPRLLESYVGHWLGVFVFYAVLQLFIVICLTFYHNYFIKRVHDQSELYFS